MIVYKETKDEIVNQIYSNIKQLKNIKELYQTKRQVSRECLLKINKMIQIEENKEKISIFMQLLNLTKDNLDLLNSQIEEIDEKILFLSNLENDIEEIKDKSFEERIDQYNKSYNEFKSRFVKIAVIEKKLCDEYAENIETHEPLDDNKGLQNNNKLKDKLLDYNNDLANKEKNKLEKVDIFENVIKDNNTLLISEVQNKVILPYKISEIKEIFMNNKNEYKNLQDVIDKKYTIPLVNYKYASISRYRETFKLMREREKASLLDSFDLAFEMFGKRYVYPAIIAACKDLDQLDIYLDCLETNELDDFPFFKINYELYPVKVKTK